MSGNKPEGINYQLIKDIDQVKQQFFRLQIAIAFMVANKDETDTKKLIHQTGVRSQDLNTYLRNMKCVTIYENNGELIGSGRTASAIVRNALPGDVCVGCPRADNCIILLGKSDRTNLQLIPESLAKRMII